jgi:chaperonin GroEL
MSAKSLLFHDAAREKLCAGLNTLSNAVKVTLGPKGRTVVLGSAASFPTIINSGVIVAREIELPDKFENLGAQMAREVAAHTSEMAGDGTTTATVLAQAIVKQGMKFVAAGFDPMDLKRGIDGAVDSVIARLKDNSRKINSNQEIAQVGAISANGDQAIGALIAQALERVGQGGVIKSEDGRGMNNELDIVEGLQFERGYLSPYFINDAERGRVVLENAAILLYQQQISAIAPLLPLLDQIIKTGQPLLIIAEDVSGDALATLVINALRGTLAVCAVKAPGFGDQRAAWFDDIALVTGATVISDASGLQLDNATLHDLGRVRRIDIGKDETTLINGAGDPQKIVQRAQQIRQQIGLCASDHEKRQLTERAARLAGGVALIKIGATTEIEMKEKKSRVDDALHATRAAVEEGVGAGGGVALLRAGAVLDGIASVNMAQQSGVKIVRRALEEPLRQIVCNAGGEPDVVIAKVALGSGDFGYNAATEEYGDMMQMGIIDPTKVTRLALQNAASIAGLMLTTDCIVVEGAASDMAIGP